MVFVCVCLSTQTLSGLYMCDKYSFVFGYLYPGMHYMNTVINHITRRRPGDKDAEQSQRVNVFRRERTPPYSNTFAQRAGTPASGRLAAALIKYILSDACMHT